MDCTTWLCLLANYISKGYKLFLWNPYVLQKIELPHHAQHSVIGDCILSSSPTAIDQICSIFLFSYHTSSIFYFQLGYEQWTEVDYCEELETTLNLNGEKVSLMRYKSYLTNPVYCNGFLFAESFERYLVVIEQQHGYRGLTINSILVLMPTLPSTRFHRVCRLLGSNNELYRIEILHTKYKVIYVVV